MTQPTGDRSTQEHFPDTGQVDFDAESSPDEAHVDGGPRETAAPPVGPEGPYDEAQVGPDATGPGEAGAGEPGTEPGPEPGPEPGTGESAEELRARVGELTADLQRLQAEYLNYKRRVDRDRDLVVQNARLAVLTSLLPVLDDVDRAREHEELSGGFKAVAEALERVVAGAGLVKFGAPGDEFDPRLHEALMHGHSSEVSTTVCDNVFQAGYRVGDRIVRAAKVTVLDPEPS